MSGSFAHEFDVPNVDTESLFEIRVSESDYRKISTLFADGFFWDCPPKFYRSNAINHVEEVIRAHLRSKIAEPRASMVDFRILQVKATHQDPAALSFCVIVEVA